MQPLFRSVCAILLPMLVVPTAADAGVRAGPRASRLLQQGGRDCESNRSFAIGLALRTCSFSYFVDPDADEDPDRDYLVDWIQVSAKPLKGRCLTGARGSISTDGATVVGATPRRQRASRRARSRLSVSSHSGQPLGTLSKRYRLAAGRLSTEVKRRARGDKFEWRWSGRSKRKAVTLVVGVANTIPGSGTGIVFSTGGDDFRTEVC